MDSKVKLRQFLLWANLCVILFCAILGFILERSRSSDMDIGVTAVKLMYDFKDPANLDGQYASLRKLVNDDAWEVLSIEDELRTINAYFKFYYKPSTVSILFYRKGLVLYTLTSDAIAPGTTWAFEYELVHGKISNVREYQWVSVYRGDKGGI